MWRRAKTEIRDALGVDTRWTSSDLDELHRALVVPTSETRAAAGSDSPDREARVTRLQQAVETFRAAHRDATMSAHQLINPLLDLWSLASAVDHTAAAPIAALLTALVDRSLTTPAELGGCMDEIEGVLPRHPVRQG